MKYKPKKEVLDKIAFVYSEMDDMVEIRQRKYGEFNDRTLVQFLDDSQKRANGYVPSRESQGKQEWQANVFTKTTRNKIKALVAGVAKDVPEISFSAYNFKNESSNKRAKVMKDLTMASYTEHTNPEMVAFLDTWNLCINGTVIKYDGYTKIKDKVKKITEYDLTKGIIETKETEEFTEDRPVEINVPIQNILIKNIYISDIQEQSAIIWVDYVDREHLKKEFQNYKDFEFIPKFSNEHSDSETQTFFMDKWKDRGRIDQYEVIRYYNKSKDLYQIVINGVLILDAPLLWGRRKKKYPFAKAVLEPMANSDFFYGNSIPNIIMDEQDSKNNIVNSLLDKTYRSVVTPMLVGIVNKDNFDLEDEYVDSDTNIYVEDINQVRPMPIAGINSGEIQMLQIINGGIEEDSTDSVQGGKSGSGSTAREIVIANERAEELKGNFYIMLKDLYLQKTRLRVSNLLQNLSSKRIHTIIDEDGQKTIEETYKTFKNKNAKLSDGSIGTSQIEIVEQANKVTDYNLDIREAKMEDNGEKVEITQVTSDYLDSWEYEIEITTQSFHQKSKALDMAIIDEKIRGVAMLFPEIFMANTQEFFKMWMEKFGDNAEEMLKNVADQQTQQAMMMQPGQPAPELGQPGGMPQQGGAPALPVLQ